jgi:Family of unknown function (DUF6998)
LNEKQSINEGLALIFKGIERLREAFPNRAFTIDGRLVGDIGEVIAALEYDVTLDQVSRPGHDGCDRDGRLVQVKATFKDSLTFKTCPDYYLGFKLYPDGRHEEVFNGPGRIILDRYVHRQGIGTQLLSFPISELRSLAAKVGQADRIPKREALLSNPVPGELQ